MSKAGQIETVERAGSARAAVRVLHVVRSLDPAAGGTSAAIPELARAASATGQFNNRLLDFGGPERPVPPACAGMPLRRLPWRPLGLMAAPGGILAEEIGGAGLVHIHGIWEPQCAAAGRIARALGKPYVVSPHGMLERWALRNKGWKKRIYGALVERANLQRAACLCALTCAEVEDCRRYGLRGPVAVIPNGVTPRQVSPQLFLERYPKLAGKRIVLFLSRVHYKKGVDMLCRAWSRIQPRFGDVRLVIAGPDFENTLAGIQRLIAELNISATVTITGMLAGDEKWSALDAASLFVLPSHSEGFSVAILEAMSSGVPVLATYECNLPELEPQGAGVLIHADEGQLERALADLLARPADSLRGMGSRGRELAARRYAWGAIGETMAQVYAWILGGSQPSGVEIDTLS